MPLKPVPPCDSVTPIKTMKTHSHFLSVSATACGWLLLSSASALAQASTVGQWSAVQNWPIVAVHSHLLPTGKILFWAYSDGIYLWDPATAVVTSAPNAGRNVFCAGESF